VEAPLSAVAGSVRSTGTGTGAGITGVAASSSGRPSRSAGAVIGALGNSVRCVSTSRPSGVQPKIRVVGDQPRRRQPAVGGPVEHQRAGDLDLAHRQVPPVPGRAVRRGQRQRQPSPPPFRNTVMVPGPSLSQICCNPATRPGSRARPDVVHRVQPRCHGAPPRPPGRRVPP
jgi:hypothetical protein